MWQFTEQQQNISCRSMVLYEGTHRLFNLQAQADQFFRSRIIQGRFQGILLQMENGKIVELNATEKIWKYYSRRKRDKDLKLR